MSTVIELDTMVFINFAISAGPKRLYNKFWLQNQCFCTKRKLPKRENEMKKHRTKKVKQSRDVSTCLVGLGVRQTKIHAAKLFKLTLGFYKKAAST